MQTVEKNDFIERAFEGVRCPESHKKAIQRIYDSYPDECMPKGICDPLYMLNILCLELGIGDGRSNFFEYSVNKQ